MKNFLQTLFLLYGVYALTAFLFLWIDGLLAMMFILLGVGTSVILLTIKRKDTEQWQCDFTQKHFYISPLLKILGVYFIYVLISTVISLFAVFMFDFDRQSVSAIQEHISDIAKIIWLLLTVGVIIKLAMDSIKKT